MARSSCCGSQRRSGRLCSRGGATSQPEPRYVFASSVMFSCFGDVVSLMSSSKGIGSQVEATSSKVSIGVCTAVQSFLVLCNVQYLSVLAC